MTQDPRGRFLALLQEAIATRTLKRLVLSRPARPMFPPGFPDEGPVLQRLRIQPVRVRDGVKLAFAWQYDTRDQTDNLSVDEALVRIDALLGDMRTALLETRDLTAELGFSKRGRPLFRMQRVSQDRATQTAPGRVSAAPGERPGLKTGTSVVDGMGADPGAKASTFTGTADIGLTVAGQSSSKADASVGKDASVGRDTESCWQPGVGALTRLRRVDGRKSGLPGPSTPDDDGWGELVGHNRQRRHPVDIDRPYLVDLGIVGKTGALVPAMARKWRQINKFVEIVAQAWQHNMLAAQVGGAGQRPLRIRDYGAGKGYLTFALHDHLTHVLGLQVETVGIERRADLVALCNRLAQRHGLSGLRFEKGDILRAGDRGHVGQDAGSGRAGDDVDPAIDSDVARDAILDDPTDSGAGDVAGVTVAKTAFGHSAGTTDTLTADECGQGADIVIALHACDTATDDALFQGIRQQAAMLVCSPCCHRELRPQLQAPAPLDALLRHGIHLGQEAEMLTDGLRALLLETQGYEAQVFEFISPEHTGKNRMILGNRTGRARDADAVRAEIEALKRFYGIRSQRLDALLDDGTCAAKDPDEDVRGVRRGGSS